MNIMNRLIADLRDGEPLNKEALYNRLAKCWNDGPQAAAACGLVECTDGTTFKRLTEFYTHNLSSIFLVPILAAEKNAQKPGFILYPPPEELTCLKVVVRRQDLNYVEILRLSFTSVALALEALHRPTYQRFEHYYHRGIHMGNVYLPVSQENGRSVYGRAKLKLCEYTTRSGDALEPREEALDEDGQPYDQIPKYSEASGDYEEGCDWYYFGVYMLKLLHWAVQKIKGSQINVQEPWTHMENRQPNFSFDHLNDHISTINAPASGYLSEWLNIAKECILGNMSSESLFGLQFTRRKNWRRSGLTKITSNLLRLDHRILEQSTQTHISVEKCQSCYLKDAEHEQAVRLYAQPDRDDFHKDFPPFDAMHTPVYASRSQVNTYCRSCLNNGEILFSSTENCISSTIRDTLCDVICKGKYYDSSFDGARQQEAILTDLEELSTLEDSQVEKIDTQFKNFKRAAETYFHNRYSKFILPVWIAASDWERANPDRSGYLMLPPTQCVKLAKTAIQEVRRLDNMKSLMSVLRLCITPVALAVDSLHEETFQRPPYHHKAVHIGNVYLPYTIKKDGTVIKYNYGEAKLKISEHTEQAPNNAEFESLNQKVYWAHPDLWTENQYRSYRSIQEYDWYSFGIYILELIHLSFAEVGSSSFQDIIGDALDDSPTSEALEVRQLLRREIERVSDRELIPRFKETLQSYLEIAGKCIKMKSSRVGKESTEILYGIFYRSRPSGNNLDNKFSISSCEACMLKPADKLPLDSEKRIWSTETQNDNIPLPCDKSCISKYCKSCYSNGERLYCSTHHSFAQPIMGPNCFALLMHGEQFGRNGNKDEFQQDSVRLKNCLEHTAIRGIPKENIVVSALYPKTSDVPTTMSDGPSYPQSLLKEAFDKLKGKIHKLDSNQRCARNFDYCLFILYSGHAKPPDNDKGVLSQLRLTESTCVPYSFMEEGIKSVLKCDGCNSLCSCRNLFWIREHCYAYKKTLDIFTNEEKLLENTWSLIASGPLFKSPGNVHNTQNVYDSQFGGCITFLFTLAFTGTKSCTKASEYPHCICNTPNLHGSARSARSLDGFYRECKSFKASRGTNSIVSIDVMPQNYYLDFMALCYYQPHVVEYVLYRYSTGRDGMVKIPFNSEIINCARTRKLCGPSDKHSPNELSLFSSIPSEYSKYSLVCDWNIKEHLDASFDRYSYQIFSPMIIFYHELAQRFKVFLRDEAMEEEEELEMQLGPLEIPNADRISEFPNVIVYLVHELYHKTLSEGLTCITTVIQSFLDTLNGRPVTHSKEAELWGMLVGKAEDNKATETRFRVEIEEHDKWLRVSWNSKIAKKFYYRPMNGKLPPAKRSAKRSAKANKSAKERVYMYDLRRRVREYDCQASQQPTVTTNQGAKRVLAPAVSGTEPMPAPRSSTRYTSSAASQEVGAGAGEGETSGLWPTPNPELPILDTELQSPYSDYDSESDSEPDFESTVQLPSVMQVDEQVGELDAIPAQPDTSP